MFGKVVQQTIQCNPFKLSGAEIKQDIKSICLDEQQRNKLYLCLDVVEPPNNQHYLLKVDAFLKGSENLENIKEDLTNLTKNLDDLIKQISKVTKHIQLQAKIFD